MITEKDFDSIKADGRSLELIKRQYEHLVGEKIKISGIRPAIIGDGILEMAAKEKNYALQNFITHYFSFFVLYKTKLFFLANHRRVLCKTNHLFLDL